MRNSEPERQGLCFFWRRLLARQAREGSTKQFDYGSALGNAELRAAICTHLLRSRAVVCEPEEVILVNGSQQALDLVVRVLVDPGDTVALEDPHYDGIRGALRAAGARLRGVPVDREGLDPARLPDDVRLVFVTPSHQFPTGAILSLERRLALLDSARRENAVSTFARLDVLVNNAGTTIPKSFAEPTENERWIM
jgi:GntR family transcriptional regulator/MocR family aminotransferase